MSKKFTASIDINALTSGVADVRALRQELQRLAAANRALGTIRVGTAGGSQANSAAAQAIQLQRQQAQLTAQQLIANQRLAAASATAAAASSRAQQAQTNAARAATAAINAQQIAQQRLAAATSRAAAAAATAQKASASLAGIGAGVGAGAAVAGGIAATAIGGIGAMIGAKGIAANAESENLLLGLRGIIASLQDVRDATGAPAEGMNRLTIAGVEAEKQLQLLKLAGMQTSAEFADLAVAFQTALGAGSSAGLGVDEIRKLTVSLTQAAGAFNLSGDQLASEIRAMLSGDQVDNSQIAQGLAIKGTQIKEWREQGVLFDKLNEKLALFNLNSEAIGKTWSATTSALNDALTMVSQDMTKGAFDNLKTALQDAVGTLLDPNTGELAAQFAGLRELGVSAFTEAGDALAAAIRAGVQLAADLSAWFDNNRDAVYDVATAMGTVVDAIVDAVAAAGDLLGIFGQLTPAGDTLRDALNGAGIAIGIATDLATAFGTAIIGVGAIIVKVLLYPLQQVAGLLDKLAGTNFAASLGAASAKMSKIIKDAESPRDAALAGRATFAAMARVEAAATASAVTLTKNAYADVTARPRGTVNRPGPRQKPDDKKAGGSSRAARPEADPLAQAELAYNKQVWARQLAELDRQLAAANLSYADYAEKRKAIKAEQLAADKAALEAELAQESRPQYKAALKVKIQALEEAGREEAALIDRQAEENARRLAESVAKLQQELSAATGNELEAQYAAIEQRYAKIRAEMIANNDVAGQEAIKKLISVERAKAEMGELKRVLSLNESKAGLMADELGLQVASGEISQTQADRQSLALRKQLAATQIEVLKGQSLENATAEERIEHEKQLVHWKGVLIEKAAEQKQVEEEVANAMAQAISDIATGSKSAADAIEDVFRNLLTTINKMLTKELADGLLQMVTKASVGGGSGGGSSGGFLQGLLGAAVGGLGSTVSGMFTPRVAAPAADAFSTVTAATAATAGVGGMSLAPWAGSNSNTVVNMLVTTPDANSFRNSSSQITRDLKIGVGG